MSPSAEDGDGSPPALVQDHGQPAQDHGQPAQDHGQPAQDHGQRVQDGGDRVRDHGQPPGVVSESPPRVPIDGFAVASLISGLLGLIPLAVIFGPVALARIARTGARGRALAITGLALGGTWAVAAALAIAVMIVIPRHTARPVALPKAFSLHTGDCINSAANGVSDMHVLACGQPHDGEVFATFRLAGQRYPGAAALRHKAGQGCASRLSGYVNPQLAALLDESYIYPSSSAWAAGERTVVCTAFGTDGKLIGSVRTATG
jgi:putative regulator of septum formation/uncharacterized protein DUF4190